VSKKLGLALRPWHGEFRSVDGKWLRWETLDGKILPTGAQMAEQAQQQAQEAQQHARDLEAMLAQYRERFGDISE
jgi:hypothetical protein